MMILMVEDDPFVGEMLCLHLIRENWKVDWVDDGNRVLEYIAEKQYDLLLLDWHLPGCDGTEICKLLRQQGNVIPIIMLTIRNTVEDLITGLECGADDYIMKPLVFPEVLSKIHSLLRRTKSTNVANIREVGRLRYSSEERTVIGEGQRVELSKKEAALFEMLLRFSNQPVQRQRLAAAVWPDLSVPADYIDPLIAQLRRRLQPFQSFCSVVNRRGHGFVLRLEP